MLYWVLIAWAGFELTNYHAIMAMTFYVFVNVHRWQVVDDCLDGVIISVPSVVNIIET